MKGVCCFGYIDRHPNRDNGSSQSKTAPYFANKHTTNKTEQNRMAPAMKIDSFAPWLLFWIMLLSKNVAGFITKQHL